VEILFDVTQIGAEQQQEAQWQRAAKAALGLQRRLAALALSDRPKVRKRAVDAVRHVARQAPRVELLHAIRRVCERAVALSSSSSTPVDDEAARLQNVLRVATLVGTDEHEPSLLTAMPLDEADAFLLLLASCGTKLFLFFFCFARFFVNKRVFS
jgi:hypothetical protein